MLEQFALPRWAALLTRVTRRRSRSRSTALAESRPLRVRQRLDALELQQGPFWDPVVCIVDPWRRCSDPLLDAAWQAALKVAKPRPRRTWAYDRPIDRCRDNRAAVSGDTGPAQPGVADLTADEGAPRLFGLKTIAASCLPDVPEDGGLTRQLIATARAVPVWPRPTLTTAPQDNGVLLTVESTVSDPSPIEEPAGIAPVAPSSEQEPAMTPRDAAARLQPPHQTSFVRRSSAAHSEPAAVLTPVEAALDRSFEPPESASSEAQPEPASALEEPRSESPAWEEPAARPTEESASIAESETAPVDAAEADNAGPKTPAIDLPLEEVTAASPEAAAQIAEQVTLPAAEAEAAPAEAPAPAVESAIAEHPPEAPAAELHAEEAGDAKVRTDVPQAEASQVLEPQVAEAESQVADAEPQIAEAELQAAETPEPQVAEAPEPPVAEAEAPAAEIEPVAPAPSPAASAATAVKSAASTVLAPAVREEYNRTGVDFRRPMPRPKVRGLVIDFHCHLLARRHAQDWFEAADHYGMDCFVTMSPLEEAAVLARDYGHRLRFIAVPQWGDASTNWADKWLNRIEAFYNLGSRIAKFHASPGTMVMRGHRLDSPVFRPLLSEVRDRGMAIMTHIGDPDTWYHGKYADPAAFGSRDDHFRMWESLLDEYRGTPWIGAHLGGNPEDLPRLQRLLDRYPDLWLDCSATRWMVREISARREPAREFFIRNADRILFGSDQVSGDDRQFDFLASRIWCHRKLWETAYIGPSPIIDPDVPADQQPTVRGLALPDLVLQKIYHDNPTRMLAMVGMGFE